MQRILLSIRAFFAVLFSARAAGQVRLALGPPEPAKADAGKSTGPAKQKPKKPAAPPKPVRSEAVSLLATLQREARLVDFIQEPLDAYSDAQIGAAVRDVHRDCGKVLDRLFAMRPVLKDEEGAEVEVPAGFDSGRYRLVGNVTGQPPHQGRMVHHGWEAAKCELPAFSGSKSAARVIAPAEVELS